MDDQSIAAARKLFPVTQRYRYFNHAAVAPLALPVKAALVGLAEDACSSGAVHFRAWEATRERAREKAARLLGVDRAGIALVHSTSEGVNIAAQGVSWRPGDNVVCVQGEFPANVLPWLNLRPRGVEVRFAPFPDGCYRVDDILSCVDRRTRVVAISHVSFQTGARCDLAALSEGLRARGDALLFADAIQALGALPCRPQEMGVEMLAADSHKWLLGLEGIGLFWCAPHILDQIRPCFFSWCSVRKPYATEPYCTDPLPDARRFEIGTSNTIGIHALDAALDLILDHGVEEIAARLRTLTDRLVDGLIRRGYHVVSPRGEGEWSGIVCFDHPDHRPRPVVEQLRAAGVIVTGRGAYVRVSPHFYNTLDEIDACLEALP